MGSVLGEQEFLLGESEWEMKQQHIGRNMSKSRVFKVRLLPFSPIPPLPLSLFSIFISAAMKVFLPSMAAK